MVLRFERDDQIEVTTGSLTAPSRNNSRPILPIRNTDASLMRMSGEILDCSRRILFVAKDLVKRFNWRDLLIVAVGPGMIVGPSDGRGLAVVRNVTRLIRIEIITVKEMRPSDSA